MPARNSCDYLVIGGGFYGCSLALFLRSVSKDIIVAEAGDELLSRASRVNQARVHTGFHYPRSAITAAKSMVLHRRFAEGFPDAVKSDFQMLYAISRRGSKVSPRRFFHMYSSLGAPIAEANVAQRALFDPGAIEAVFACDEYVFDYSRLRSFFAHQIDSLDVDLRMGSEVVGIEELDGRAVARLSSGEEIEARFIFNVTYAQINSLLRSADCPEAELKHELAEIALIQPPPELGGIGVTVMDGPFFSAIPFPAESLYSLTHVRYTPHLSWTDQSSDQSPYGVFDAVHPQTRHRHMLLDGQRYLPCLRDAHWKHSLYDVKTLLIKNENDDGRPILFHRIPGNSPIISILGGKIDNIYDLFALLKTTEPEWADADERYVHPAQPRPKVSHL